MWLIRKGRMPARTVCCVAVRGTRILLIAARRVVTGTSLPSVTISSIGDSVFASPWSDFPHRQNFPNRVPQPFRLPSQVKKNAEFFLLKHKLTWGADLPRMGPNAQGI